jgi:hypothetical protein
MRFEPFAQTGIFRQAIGHDVDTALMVAAVDHSALFFLGKRLKLRQQSPVQRSRAVSEQMHEHRTASGDFARFKRARALVALQVQKLKPIRKGHSRLL